MEMIGLYVLGALAGAMVMLETPANSHLRERTGSAYLASFVSFAVGTALLLALCLAQGLPDGGGDSEWWYYTGGAFGVLIVVGNVLLFPRLGAVMAVALPMVGQAVWGTAIDALGLFGFDRKPFGAEDAAGLALVIAGIYLAVVAGTGKKREGAVRGAWAWRAVGIAIGVAMATQAAVNGNLGESMGSSITASTVSFGTGMLIMLAIVLATRSYKGFGNLRGDLSPWWMWAGGLLGAAFVLFNTYLAPRIGAGADMVLILLGQLSCSLAVDHWGLLRSEKRRTALTQVAGIAVLFAGIVLCQMS